MTHGGLNSLQEAIYHGVPVLGLPLGLDQTSNLLRSVREGYALKLDWKEVSEEKLYNSLQDLLYNTRYSIFKMYQKFKAYSNIVALLLSSCIVTLTMPNVFPTYTGISWKRR